VSTLLEDSSGGEILPGKAEELAEQIGAKVLQAKTAAATSAISELRDAYEARQKEHADGKQPASKKLKSVDTARLDAYGKIKDMKVAGLSDVLQWNRHYKTGNKEMQMEKVIDGEVYGRLARCPLCSGRIKIKDGTSTVVCNGTFDESSQVKIECAYQATPSEAPRWKPWYVRVGPTLGSTDQSDLAIIARHSRVTHSASPVFHTFIYCSGTRKSRPRKRIRKWIV
jgi:hypothetical protein